MAWFRNHYRCNRCGATWTDEWSCMCDDDCPTCGARHMSSSESDDLTVIIEERDGAFRVLRSSDTAGHTSDYEEVASFPTRGEAEAYLVGAAMNKIAELNDAFRTTFRGGKVVMTASVDALPDMVKANALMQVAQFDNFNADNDPHGEHDFGSFELCGRKFFWKIDYYDKDIRYGSEDPADPENTTRVLTLMLAEDY